MVLTQKTISITDDDLNEFVDKVRLGKETL